MKCPECTMDKLSTTNLMIHAWQHRYLGFSPSLYPCPWCGFISSKLVDSPIMIRDQIREQHLQNCTAYAATCLAGVAIYEPAVEKQLEIYLECMDRKPRECAKNFARALPRVQSKGRAKGPVAPHENTRR